MWMLYKHFLHFCLKYLTSLFIFVNIFPNIPHNLNFRNCNAFYVRVHIQYFYLLLIPSDAKFTHLYTQTHSSRPIARRSNRAKFYLACLRQCMNAYQRLSTLLLCLLSLLRSSWFNRFMINIIPIPAMTVLFLSLLKDCDIERVNHSWLIKCELQPNVWNQWLLLIKLSSFYCKQDAGFTQST